jgi:hypothetical protein
MTRQSASPAWPAPASIPGPSLTCRRQGVQVRLITAGWLLTPAVS